MSAGHLDCIPKDKHDTAAVLRAGRVGFPALEPILPSLLGWLQDANWPVAPGVADLLITAGAALDGPVLEVLASEDAEWKEVILTLVLSRMSAPISPALVEALARMAAQPTGADAAAGLDEAAAAVLQLPAFARA